MSREYDVSVCGAKQGISVVTARARVLSCAEMHSGVFQLKVNVFSGVPLAGQFYMLRSVPSETFLGRPISVFRTSCMPDSNELCLEFLILSKGRGTEQLCALLVGNEVDMIGPLGNSFEKPADSGIKVALVGGGIGVAPVAGFAERLAVDSYDFYGAFRGSPYGLDYIKPARLHICSDDGSSGVKGMLPAIFGVKEAASYGAVYACGPDAMLEYVQKTCIKASVPSYLSTEAHMACGVGGCLGCTIKTVHGNKRCCKDGPVFSGADLIFRRR